MTSISIEYETAQHAAYIHRKMMAVDMSIFMFCEQGAVQVSHRIANVGLDYI